MRKVSNSTSETHQLASGLSKKILKQKSDEATVVALVGELGSGKTVFTKGFAKSLGIKDHITSPTFVILKRYKISDKRLIFKNLIHIDAYRIKKAQEMTCLDWEKFIKDPWNIILVEWAENIGGVLPREHYLVNFNHKDEKKRTIDITHKK